MCKKNCYRCALVIAWQCLHIVFSLPSPFLLPHSLTWGKTKCFHTLDLKLAGASSISQTLALGSLSPHVVSVTCALLIDPVSTAQRMMDMQGPVVAVVPTPLHSACLQLKEKHSLCPKPDSLKASFIQRQDTYCRYIVKLITAIHPYNYSCINTQLCRNKPSACGLNTR